MIMQMVVLTLPRSALEERQRKKLVSMLSTENCVKDLPRREEELVNPKREDLTSSTTSTKTITWKERSFSWKSKSRTSEWNNKKRGWKKWKSVHSSRTHMDLKDQVSSTNNPESCMDSFLISKDTWKPRTSKSWSINKKKWMRIFQNLLESQCLMICPCRLFRWWMNVRPKILNQDSTREAKKSWGKSIMTSIKRKLMQRCMPCWSHQVSQEEWKKGTEVCQQEMPCTT
mgnify:CR=1 FL=1